MKKLKLKVLGLTTNEVLTRAQLKKVSGGGSHCLAVGSACSFFNDPPCCLICLPSFLCGYPS
ncbi:hypothetical protein HDF23_003637 [Mucilaginibacter lappiensis]|uniref:Natural product n=1 Tax=Mucilaginibacter lappiensis TaxID=354630 RepID=A0ABR6PM77_9SPHI|nr:hypothetical protein [Mucilaginibacter lappiensis]